MELPRRNLFRLVAGAAAASLVSRTVVAQTFPARPITIVVPFPAGGPTDTLGRVLADRMRNALGQSVIIENLTGAAGTIGSTHVARSFLMATRSFSAIGRLMSSMAPPIRCRSTW